MRYLGQYSEQSMEEFRTQLALLERQGGPQYLLDLYRRLVGQESLTKTALTTPAPTPAPAPAPAPAPVTTAPAPTTVAPVVATPLDVYEYRYEPGTPFTTFMPGEPSIVGTRSGEVLPEPRPSVTGGLPILWIVAAGFGLFIIFGQRKRRKR